MPAREPIGDAQACHAIAVDARAPKFDGGIVTRLDSIPLGIVVNRKAGASTTRARTSGRNDTRVGVARRRAAGPDGVLDRRMQKAAGRFMPSVFPPNVARDDRRAGARCWGCRRCARGDRAAFNRAVRPGTFDHTVLDDCRTEGLAPPKSHWAQTLDTPPFWAYPLRPGITFTYLGVRVDEPGARRDDRAGRRRRTSSRRARSWPATSCARATSPAWA